MAKKRISDPASGIISIRQPLEECPQPLSKAEYGERIRSFRLKKGYNQPQLAALLGITKNAVTNWEHGLTSPTYDMIPLLCRALDISPDILFGMEAETPDIAENEAAHLALYRSLDGFQRRIADDLMESLLRNGQLAFREKCMEGFARLPHNILPASAGTGMFLTDTDESPYVFLRKSKAVSKADTIITVRGDSMNATFSDGDELLVEYTSEVMPGEVGIFIVGGEGYVKEFQPDGLHSHNPRYAVIHPQPDDNFRCVGRVLDVVTDEMRASAQEQAMLEEIYAPNS